MPESCRICGLPMAPALKMTSRRASALCMLLPREYSTPVTVRPSSFSRCVNAPVITVRLGRFMAGRRKALAPLQRTPSFCVTSKRDTPSLSPRLKSSMRGTPFSTAASRKASMISHCTRGVSTRRLPPSPCFSSAPRQLSSISMKVGNTLAHDQPESPVSMAHSS